MFPWLWFWAPQLHFPWSGNVAQQIEPDTNWFFGAIPAGAGAGAVEKKAFAVASYGRQLGLITEVLLDRAQHDAPASAQAQHALERLREIQARIEQIKREDIGEAVDAIAGQAERLRQRSPEAFAQVALRLGLQPAPAGG
jgi:hypothetical protein